MPLRRIGRPGLIGLATRTASTPGPVTADDMIATLQQLASLKDTGVLSEAEFAAAKQKLLS